MAASDVNLAAGCAVKGVTSQPMHRRASEWEHATRENSPPLLDRGPTSGAGLCGRIRCLTCSATVRARPGLVLRATVARLILLTEYDPACHHRLNVNQSSLHLKRSEHGQPDRSAEDHGDRGRTDRADSCYRRSVDGVGHTGLVTSWMSLPRRQQK